MKSCWAKSLGNCDDKISREHLVSSSVFNSNKVIIKGFDWCKDEQKEVGLNSIRTHILCRKHNSILSPIDTEAGGFISTINRCRVINQTRSKKGSGFKVIKYDVNFDLIERWFLKTTLNLAYKGKYKVGYENSAPGCIPEEFVEIVFGKRKFNKNRGLYLAKKVNQKLDFKATFEFRPIVFKERNILEGVFFTFHSFSFYLSLVADPFTEERKKMWGFGNDLDGYILSNTTPKIEFLIEDKPSLEVHLISARFQSIAGD